MSGTGRWVRQRKNLRSSDNVTSSPPFKPPPPVNVVQIETEMEVIDNDVKDEIKTEREIIEVPVTEGIKENKDAILSGRDWGIKKKRKKPTPGMKNLRLKKLVRPKNAVMCLNELRPDIVYNFEAAENGIGCPARVSVEVDGIKFMGMGSTKMLAKQEAAETALVSFVKPPPLQGEDSVVDEDTTPWSVLACFAMHRLFNSWMIVNKNKNSYEAIMEQQQSYAPQMVMGNHANQQMNYQQAASMLNSNMNMPPQQMTADNVQKNNVLSSYLGIPMEKEIKEEVVGPKPSKKGLPENAATMHPTMLLHQMKPGIQFEQTKFIDEQSKEDLFRVTVVVDNNTYIGEGKSVKKAKYNMAVQANNAVFGISCTYANPI